MNHDFWYLSRAAGITAYALLALAVVMGLLMTSRLAGRLRAKPFVFELHQHAALLALITSVFHAAVLLGDSYFDFTIWKLAVPLASPYRPWAAAAGTLGLYGLAATTLSFYLRRRLGYASWRRLHYATFGVFILATVHGLAAGTDTSMRTMYALASGAVLMLTLRRLPMPLPEVPRSWSRRVRLAGAIGATGVAAIMLFTISGLVASEPSRDDASGERLAAAFAAQRQSRELATILDARLGGDGDDDADDDLSDSEDARHPTRREEREHDDDDDDEGEHERDGDTDDD